MALPPPRAGDVLRVTRSANPQFSVPMLFRVIRTIGHREYNEGWVWLDGYQLDTAGDAVERREIYVRVAELQHAQPASGWVTSTGATRPVTARPTR